MMKIMTEFEVSTVAGGNIIREIEERHPGGEWCGNSYFPNGCPHPEPDYIPLPW